MRKSLFISYSWSDSSLVDKVELAFNHTDLKIKRDIRDIEYNSSIRGYMSQIRETDFALIVISDKFIKSANCMYEVLEILKEKNYKNKIVPVLVDGTKVFKPSDRLRYIKYWSKEYLKLERKLKTLNVTDTLNLYEELKLIEKIRITIDEFLAYISDNNILKFSDLHSKNFTPILNYIGVSDKALLNRILALSKISDLSEIDIELEKIHSEHPNNAEVYFAKASYAFKENKIAKSSFFYQKAIEIDPTSSASYYNLAFNVEVYEKDLNKARELYDKAIVLDNTNIWAMNNLASLYANELQNPDKANELYIRALGINPNSSMLHFNYALLLHRTYKKIDEARRRYEYVTVIDPSLAHARYNLGLLLWEELGEYSQAKEEFQKVIEMEPDHKLALKQLGRLLEEEYKHFREAKIYFDRYIKIEPNDAEDHYYYSTFLMLYFKNTSEELAKHHFELACVLDKSFDSKPIKHLFKK
jgi:tetratricopeptide (TPR) repeat protein